MSIRTKRVASVIKDDLGHMLQQDYQPAGSFITITNVNVSPDLMNVKVFVSIYAPGKDDEAIYQHLVNNNATIREHLATKIRHQLRRVPELDFSKDESAKHAAKMDQLFDQIHEEEAQRANGE